MRRFGTIPRLPVAGLLAIAIALAASGPARAMGDLPEGERLCIEALAILRADPFAIPDAKAVRALAQPTVDRFASLQARLAEVEDELDLADTWTPPDAETVHYIEFQRQSLYLLSAELDSLQFEIDCWDAVLEETARRRKLNPLPSPPIIAQPQEPAPALPPDPPTADEQELLDALRRLKDWLGARAELDDERLDRNWPRLDEFERQAREREEPGWAVDLRVAGGALVPLDHPDLEDTQEIEQSNGAFVEFGGEVKIRLPDSRFFFSPGVSVGLQTSRLLDLINKDAPGSLELQGDETGLSALGTLKLGFVPQEDLELWVGGGVGYARRHLEMRAAGPEIFDDGGGALAWQLEAGGGYDLCGCGLFADLFVRYRAVGAIEVSPPAGPELTLGERRDLMVGVGLRYSFQP